VHAAYADVRFRLLHIFTWTNREFAWLALAGYVACFAVVGLLLTPLVLAARRWVGAGVLAGIFASLAALSMLLLWQKIHPAAQVVLAVGFGARFGALVAARPDVWMRRLRFLVLTGTLLLGVDGWVGRSAAGLAKPSGSPGRNDAPNVVLLIMDTVRAASMSLYGYSRPTTPVLDSLAAHAVVFDHAYSVAPWTAPSHASMMSGQWASVAGADYLHPMHDSLATVAQMLGAQGYVSGGFMSNTGYAGHQSGISRGFTHFEDFPLSVAQALWSTTLTQTGSGRLIVQGILQREPWRVRNAITRPDLRTVTVREGERQSAAVIADRFITWRDRERAEGRPYFAMLNFMDAHAPYDPPDGFRSRFANGAREVDRYDGGIAYEDSVIGTIVSRLRDRGELDRTILIVTSDHGEQWGEHGLESHGNSLFLPLLHVPLLIRDPRLESPGRRVVRLVSLRDLAATILDLVGVPSGTIPGHSLAGTWSGGEASVVSPVIAEAAAAVNPSEKNLTRHGPIKSTLDSAWHFIRYGNGSESLFAWRTDSAEVNDQAATEAGRQVLSLQRARISEALGLGWPPPRTRLH